MHCRFLSIVLFLLLCMGHVTRGQFYSAAMHSLSRSAAQVGETFELKVSSGEQLVEVHELVFSHPGISAKANLPAPDPLVKHPQPIDNIFQVSIDATVRPGIYEVRARTRHGLTNPRVLLVSQVKCDLVTVSHDRAKPTRLAWGEFSFARATAAEIDFYQIKLESKQALRIELLAQRLDSRMIGQLRLRDASGVVVASARGADETDPRLLTDSLPPGDYRLEVHDFTFRGGTDFHYQLLVQDREMSPPVLSAASEGQLPATSAVRACAVSANRNVQPPASPLPMTIDVPSDTLGWFSTDGTDEVFHFHADSGDRFAIDVISDRWGEPTDPRLIVQRIEAQKEGPPKFHEVLNVDDSQNVGDADVHLRSKDPVSIFNAPETADYRIVVRDLDQGVSLRARQKFLLRVREPDPGFDLVAYRVYPHRDSKQSRPVGSKLFRGGAEAIRVLAIRRDGWTGGISLSIEGLAGDLNCRGAVIGSNQNSTHLVVSAAENAVDSSFPIRVVGRSADGAVQQNAKPATILWRSGSGRNFVQSRLGTELWGEVSSLDLSPLSIQFGDERVREVKQNETLTTPIKLIRREGGKANCTLRPRDLPPGVTMGEVTINGDQTEGNAQIKTSGNAIPGTYSIWLQAETKIKWRPNPQALQRAESQRAYLQTLHDDPANASNLEAIKQAITKVDKQIAAAQGAAKEIEQNVFIPSPNMTFRVVQP